MPTMKDMCETIEQAGFLRRKDGTPFSAKEIYEYSPIGELYNIFFWYKDAKSILDNKVQARFRIKNKNKTFCIDFSDTEEGHKKASEFRKSNSEYKNQRIHWILEEDFSKIPLETPIDIVNIKEKSLAERAMEFF